MNETFHESTFDYVIDENLAIYGGKSRRMKERLKFPIGQQKKNDKYVTCSNIWIHENYSNVFLFSVNQT